VAIEKGGAMARVGPPQHDDSVNVAGVSVPNLFDPIASSVLPEVENRILLGLED